MAAPRLPRDDRPCIIGSRSFIVRPSTPLLSRCRWPCIVEELRVSGWSGSDHFASDPARFLATLGPRQRVDPTREFTLVLTRLGFNLQGLFPNRRPWLAPSR